MLNGLLQNMQSMNIIEELIHIILMMIMIHVLWRKYSLLLFTLLLIMLGYETIMHKELSPYFVPIVSVGFYLGETVFLWSNDYPWKYENNALVPLWKLPFWGILGIYMMQLNIISHKIKN